MESKSNLHSWDQKLAPPGAGLPWPELQVARIMYWMQRSKSDHSTATETFAIQRDRILALIPQYDSAQLSKQVLIPRLRGLEDSSRNWSFYMTISHLVIVNDLIAATISKLLAGETIERVVGTADIKPLPAVGPEVIQEFSASSERYLILAKSRETFKSTMRYPHPWFGNLDGWGWHFLAGFHMRLHVHQIRKILENL